MDKFMERVNSSTSDKSSQFSALHAQELEVWQKLFYLQTVATQDFLEKQASWLAWAMINDLPQVCFWLPELVAFKWDSTGQVRFGLVPDVQRHQNVIIRWRRLTQTALHTAMQQRFVELEECPDNAVVISAGLLRFACSMYMVHHMVHPWWLETGLPDGEPSLSAFV